MDNLAHFKRKFNGEKISLRYSWLVKNIATLFLARKKYRYAIFTA